MCLCLPDQNVTLAAVALSIKTSSNINVAVINCSYNLVIIHIIVSVAICVVLLFISNGIISALVIGEL